MTPASLKPSALLLLALFFATGCGGQSVGTSDSNGDDGGAVAVSCIPGGTVAEADGSVAQTDVWYPDRCADGLTCDPTNHCVPIPACTPTSGGECVVYSTGADASRAGSGGSAGVMALAADDTRLYWIEYGTRDNLGNYQRDGSLKAFAFADATVTTIASGLDGPLDLGVTSSHIYVEVERPGVAVPSASTQPQLLRMPLAGGTFEVVQDPARPVRWDPWYGFVNFLGAGAQAFWTDDIATYSISPTAGATPSALVTPGGSSLAADATNLYYNDCWGCNAQNATLFRVSFDGGTPETLISPSLLFVLSGDYLYGIEEINNSTGLILDRASKGGGTWQRVRALGSGGSVRNFQLIGDRYFLDEHLPDTVYVQPGSELAIVTGLLASDNPPVRLREWTALRTRVDRLWIGTAGALYWSDASVIYSRSLAGLP